MEKKAASFLQVIISSNDRSFKIQSLESICQNIGIDWVLHLFSFFLSFWDQRVMTVYLADCVLLG